MSQDSLLLEMSIRPYQKAQYSLWAITAKEAILATLETAWDRSPLYDIVWASQPTNIPIQ